MAPFVRSSLPSLRRCCGLLPALSLVIAPAAQGSAQDVTVGVSQSWSNHDRVGDPFGIGLAVDVPVRRRARVRIGLERSQDEFATFGSTCTGLIPPSGDCAPEERDEESAVWAITAGVPLTVMRRSRFEVRVVPGVRVDRIESDQTGRRSGRTRSAGRWMPGVQLGAEAALAPSRRWPVRLVAGLRVGVLGAFTTEHIVDGYTPFNDEIAFARLDVGMSVAR